ncbi:MAG: dTDP-4-dehydrorhamnose 3,5-epimerase [Verrucomicrobia bacterium]|nr:dTDP-4-dehydrorhamnose 3,5-epimerase [Verrucomicrobiota bacterium]
MKFTETELKGAWVIDLEPQKDFRGFFSRTFCQKEFSQHGLQTEYVQTNTSWNEKRGTLRGMHYQRPPHSEVKLVRCTRGAIYDVIIDLRPGSPTFCKWLGFELTADNRRTLYVPEGFGHGYQTLVPDAEVFYMVSAFYAPGAEGGVRWNDPRFAIRWPVADPVLSPKDAAHPDFVP